MVKVDHGIELVPETSMEVVTSPFGLRTVEDTYRALERVSVIASWAAGSARSSQKRP